MTARNAFHLTTAAAEKYQRQKVPAIFAPLAEATLAAVALPENGRVLDAACGTGIVARLVAERLPGSGRIVGTDLNPAMVAVAEATMPATRHATEWVAADITSLPFADAAFDIVFCQQGLQFFPDKPAALAEIGRVLAPGGRLVLTVWSAVSPLFQAIADSLRQRIDAQTARKALDPFQFRDAQVIAGLLRDAGFVSAEPARLTIDRSLAPVRATLREELLASPYEPELRAGGETAIAAVIGDVEQTLAPYQAGAGLVVPQESHLFQAIKP